MNKKKYETNQPTREIDSELVPLLYWHNLVYQILPISMEIETLVMGRLAAPIFQMPHSHQMSESERESERKKPTKAPEPNNEE